MSVKLNPTLEKHVIDHVAQRAHYASADAFVEQAVQSLLESDRAEFVEIEDVRRRIASGEREIEAGEFVEYQESTLGELARDIHARGLGRLRHT
ncbi:MAG: hypothetical protein ABIR70_18525 [Bryobacteraceae bacterium]